LHLNAVLKRADVMTDVKFSRWTVARQNNIVFHYETSFPSSTYEKKRPNPKGIGRVTVVPPILQ
jgi:hypothetical protein